MSFFLIPVLSLASSCDSGHIISENCACNFNVQLLNGSLTCVDSSANLCNSHYLPQQIIENQTCICKQSYISYFNGIHFYCFTIGTCFSLSSLLECDNNGVTSCKVNQLFIVKTNAGNTVCNVCPDQFCNGVVHLDKCPFNQYYENYQAATALVNCVSCPKNFVCDGYFAKVCPGICNNGIITSCPINAFISETQCVDCGDRYKCNGTSQKFECSGKSIYQICSNGSVVKCIAGYQIVNNPLPDCRICTGATYICDGTQNTLTCDAEIMSCKDGVIQSCVNPQFGMTKYSNGSHCIECQAGNYLCNGKDLVDCATLGEGVSCAKGRLTRCYAGTKIGVPVNISCFQCSVSYFCDGLIEIECQAQSNALSCQNGIIERCQNSFKIANHSCISCGSGVVCAGRSETPCNQVRGLSCLNGLLYACNRGLRIDDNRTNCLDCSLGAFCDGFREQSCNEVNNSLMCQQGLVQTCKPGFKLGSENLSCVHCNENSFCNGVEEIDICPGKECQNGVISSCQLGKYTNSLTCLECGSGYFCNGKAKTPCYDVPFAFSCNGLITQCTIGMKLINGSACSNCTQNRHCDGSEVEYECQAGQVCNNGILQCGRAQFIDQNTCHYCQSGYSCNGTHTRVCSIGSSKCENGILESCGPGYYIYNNLECISCNSNEICYDGKVKQSCPEAGGQLCENRQIVQCIVGLFMAERNTVMYCDECPNYAICNGTNKLGCKIGYDLFNNNCTKNTSFVSLYIALGVLGVMLILSVYIAVPLIISKKRKRERLLEEANNDQTSQHDLDKSTDLYTQQLPQVGKTYPSTDRQKAARPGSRLLPVRASQKGENLEIQENKAPKGKKGSGKNQILVSAHSSIFQSGVDRMQVADSAPPKAGAANCQVQLSPQNNQRRKAVRAETPRKAADLEDNQALDAAAVGEKAALRGSPQTALAGKVLDSLGVQFRVRRVVKQGSSPTRKARRRSD